MGFAKFTTKDPYVSSVMLEELYTLLSDMDGVMDWSVGRSGDVTVEYDHNRINDKMIEEALAGIGFQYFVKLGAR